MPNKSLFDYAACREPEFISHLGNRAPKRCEDLSKVQRQFPADPGLCGNLLYAESRPDLSLHRPFTDLGHPTQGLKALGGGRRRKLPSPALPGGSKAALNQQGVSEGRED